MNDPRIKQESQKKPRETPIFDLGPDAKPLVRRLCPMHEARRPAFRWWRGFRTSTHLRATDPTSPLVTVLPYATALAIALLNVGASVMGPKKCS